LYSKVSCTNVFAFGADRLIPTEPTPFIMEYVHRVLIQGFPVQKVLPSLLKLAEPLGLHTSIVHIHDASIVEYIWSDPDLAPNGHPLSIQCGGCGAIRSMNGKSEGKMGKGGKVTEVFTCSICAHSIRFPAQESFGVVKVANPRACWLSSTLSIHDIPK